MKKFLVNLSENNMNFLENLSKEIKAPKSKILNKLIEEYQNRQKENERELKENLLEWKKDKFQKKTKEVKIFFTEKEYSFLKESAKKNQHKYITKELRYLIMNAIYDDRFVKEFEYRKFNLTATQLNQLGRNINQTLIQIRQRNVVKINENLLKETLNNVNEKLDNLAKDLSNLVDKHRDKIK